MLEHAEEGSLRRTNLEESYLGDVLRLRDGETEDQLDDRLRTEAKELGVELGALAPADLKTASTEAQLSDMPRRSQESVGSKASQSTSLMSNFSDMSKDPYHQVGRGRSRASLSFRDYDAFVSRGVTSGRHSISFSPPTTPSQSTFSLPLSSPESSPKRHFRRIRGLSMLRLHKNASSISLNECCPHCPQDMQSQRRAIHKLPCGHKLCTQALRNTIKTATDGERGAVPCCCGIPIPGKVVEQAMTRTEQATLLERLEQHDEAVSIAPSLGSEPRMSMGAPGRADLSNVGRTTSDESKVDSSASDLQHDLSTVPATPELRALQAEQSELRDRFTAWLETQRVALEAEHERLRTHLRTRHEVAVDDLLEAHNTSMSDAEDKQVKAEADLREAHDQEKRDNATALKHMEAYCAGTYSTGELHNRTVTDQDRVELEKTRKTRDQMDAKHESAINVLRGEQNRRMKLRAQRQEREVQELRKAQRKEELDLERLYTQENHQLDDSAAEKSHRMRARWQLQAAILVKKLEAENVTPVTSGIPTIDCHPDTGDLMTVEGAPGPEYHDSRKSGISTGIAMRGTDTKRLASV